MLDISRKNINNGLRFDELSKSDIELLYKIAELHLKEREEFYNNSEINRRSFLKEKLNVLDKEITDIEKVQKEHLFDYLLKYKNMETYIKLSENFINPKYIDSIRDFIKVDKNNVADLNYDSLKTFREYSKKMVSRIPESSIKKYKETGTTNGKHLFFLRIHECLK